jgi:GntR family transcriptional regulator/MocR family aminotransferase
MAQRAVGPISTGLGLERNAPVPLHRQVYEGLRAAILHRHVAPGARLPSTRTVARDLGISRYTVVEAFRQRLAEGYIAGKAGSGTYVTRTLPEELLHPFCPPSTAPAPPAARRLPCQRSAGQMTLGWHLVLARRARQRSGLAFQVGAPALDAFPGELWERLVAHHGRHMPARTCSTIWIPPGIGPCARRAPPIWAWRGA